jgi:hypothetical protein
MEMKAYLGTTGLLFGVLALAHLLKTVDEWSRFATEPAGFLVEAPGIGLLALGLCVWAFRLLRSAPRTV